MPKVSVIIPTHNRAEFLYSAIMSVLNQTFRDFEIIVVDDTSTDNTPDIMQGFNDKRIKYIRQEVNKGVSAARNTGIKASSTDYIAFLDDDDEWLPQKLELQINLLDNSPSKVGVIYTGYMVINRTSGEVKHRRILANRGNIFDEMLKANLIGATSCILIRKECFYKAGLFDENMSFAEDWDMWIRISKDFHFDCIEELLVNYYIHDGDKLTVNLNAINKGVDIMLKKYNRSSILKRSFSYDYLRLGVLFCYNKNVKKGRQALLRAIRLYPFEIRHYFNLFLSLISVNNFNKLKDVKGKVFASFKKNKKCT